jgi:hypothetical protein
MLIANVTQLALERYFRMANMRAVDTAAGKMSDSRVGNGEFDRQYVRVRALLKANGAGKIDLTPGRASFAVPGSHRLQVIENTVGSV